MTTAQAIAQARQWVRAEAAQLSGYCGAYLSGSALERGMEEEWPADSDVDVVLLFEGELPARIGKFRWNGTLLEITVMERKALADIRNVLSTHYLAFALNGGGVLDDPQGFLAPLSRDVQAEFWKEEWLLARMESTAGIAYRHISGMTATKAPEDRLMSCGFGPSAIALPLLAAAGRNCTVRKRLPKARAVLQAHGFGEFAVRLEAALGCSGVSAEELLPHMDALERTYYRAMDTQGPSAEYAFRSDIRPDAKAVAIDGTRELLLGGAPSDAVFWMIATFARCMIILRMDDIAAYEACLPDMLAFASALGVGDAEAVAGRQRLALDVLAEAGKIAKMIAATTAKQYKG